MQYPLPEKIGNPELLVGREREFKQFHKWIDNMPKLLSKSWAILGRRKSGKTAFVQRLFNELWSANGPVIPFYFSVPETAVSYRNFATLYFRTFASHYISFVARDPGPIQKILTMEEARSRAVAMGLSDIVRTVDSMLNDEAHGRIGVMWDSAYRAPHQIAAVHDQRILVIIDEFQYLSTNIYARDDMTGDPVESMPGSFHEVSESKYAPMLATGSYVGWMVDIMGKYLEAGRLSHINFSPYLAEPEGLQAVYKYAELFGEPITNETAVQINELCGADPFFISCVIQSRYPERDLTTTAGVIETVNFEIAERGSELSGTWQEYIDKTVNRINDRHGKLMLLHLNKYNDRYWTPRQLKEMLHLDESETSIHGKLISMVKGDLIEWGSSDIRFRGLQDGTLNLILRHRFEEEIAQHQTPPDLRPGFTEQVAALQRENQSLRGKLSQVVGVMAEVQLANAFRSRKRFQLSEFFTGGAADVKLNLTDVRTRVIIQRTDGKSMEIDIVAEANDGQVLLVEVRKRQAKSTVNDVADFQEKAVTYQTLHPEQRVVSSFLSLGGFTEEAIELCQNEGIAWSTELLYF